MRRLTSISPVGDEDSAARGKKKTIKAQVVMVKPMTPGIVTIKPSGYFYQKRPTNIAGGVKITDAQFLDSKPQTPHNNRGIRPPENEFIALSKNLKPSI